MDVMITHSFNDRDILSKNLLVTSTCVMNTCSVCMETYTEMKATYQWMYHGRFGDWIG